MMFIIYKVIHVQKSIIIVFQDALIRIYVQKCCSYLGGKGDWAEVMTVFLLIDLA